MDMDRLPPTLDLNLDGSFRPAPRVGLPLSFKVTVIAGAVAGVALLFALAALAVWVLSLLIPVALVALLVAWGSVRFRQWQARRRPSARRGTVAARR